MGQFVKTIIGVLTGSSSKDAEKAAQDQRDIAKVTADRQLASLQDEEKKAVTGRAPRGRRLLINESTGESGVGARTDKLGAG